MSRTTEIEGPEACWLVRLSMLAALWLTRNSGLGVREALVYLVTQLSAQTQCSLEVSRCTALIPGDLFSREELLSIAECLTRQRLEQLLASERAIDEQQLTSEQEGDCRSPELLAGGKRTRGPPHSSLPAARSA